MRNRGRTKLTFQRKIDGDDGFGTVIKGAGGWGEDFDIGVSLTPLTGREAEINGAVQGVQVYACEVRTHYVLSTVKIDVTWRAVDQSTGRVFNINTVAPSDSDFRFTRITLTTGEPT